ncbi:uncharacterized protein LOC128557287 [Mercenaria mercenaria]|uniref:uncharacterized protein LOC128557287 n=1 Tax=Mercenaria mercenaria TaxID=6596 RepID=UPI00234F3E94|nr:uncharacterized protein LOC128557287 [Mercenaria mercenaria]
MACKKKIRSLIEGTDGNFQLLCNCVSEEINEIKVEDAYQLTEDNTTELIRTDLLRIKYPLFQSNVPAEFPHIVNGTPRIPHIIHQIGDSTKISDNFLEGMRSFVKQNPTWVYRFWTYDSGYRFLKKYHPYLVDIYHNFGEKDVKKADLLRYAVIYTYGGIYADLDVKNLRSLNITTTKYACIIPTEPFEHAGIIYRENFILSSSVLLCRPNHPFFEMLLKYLQLANPRGHPVATTGPVYLTRIYMKYNNLSYQDVSMSVLNDSRSNSPYFYKGTIDEESDEGIYIPNSQYFGDKVEPDRINKKGDLKDCAKELLVNAPVLKQRACKEFESRKVLRKDKTFTFTLHYWFHLWSQGKETLDFMQRYDITEVIPNAVLFQG